MWLWYLCGIYSIYLTSFGHIFVSQICQINMYLSYRSFSNRSTIDSFMFDNICLTSICLTELSYVWALTDCYLRGYLKSVRLTSRCITGLLRQLYVLCLSYISISLLDKIFVWQLYVLQFFVWHVQSFFLTDLCLTDPCLTSIGLTSAFDDISLVNKSQFGSSILDILTFDSSLFDIC